MLDAPHCCKSPNPSSRTNDRRVLTSGTMLQISPTGSVLHQTARSAVCVAVEAAQQLQNPEAGSKANPAGADASTSNVATPSVADTAATSHVSASAGNDLGMQHGAVMEGPAAPNATRRMQQPAERVAWHLTSMTGTEGAALPRLGLPRAKPPRLAAAAACGPNATWRGSCSMATASTASTSVPLSATDSALPSPACPESIPMDARQVPGTRPPTAHSAGTASQLCTAYEADPSQPVQLFMEQADSGSDVGCSRAIRSNDESSDSLASRSLRICCLLPSATEIVGQLGLAEHLVCVTHECDAAPDEDTLQKLLDAGAVARVTASAINPSSLSQHAIDGMVKGSLRDGSTLYSIDHAVFAAARPTLVITQGLCDVCAPSGAQVAEACSVIGGVHLQSGHACH
jgi:hypothetical protein